MPDGHPLFLMFGIVRCCLVPVSIHRETFITLQFRNVRQSIRELLVRLGRYSPTDIPDQLAATAAFESRKIGPITGCLLETRPVFLKKTPTAEGGFDHALDSQAQPSFIRNAGAFAGVGTQSHQASQRLKKQLIHSG